MFDIGFWELVVVGVVALIVLGPERLPVVARKVGYWVGRVRRFVNDAKQEVDRELNLREVRDAIERNASLDEIKRLIDTERYRIEDEFTRTEHVVKARDDEPRVAIPSPPAEVDENLQYGHTEHQRDPMDDLEPPVQHENATPVVQTGIPPAKQETPASPAPGASDHDKHSGG